MLLLTEGCPAWGCWWLEERAASRWQIPSTGELHRRQRALVPGIAIRREEEHIMLTRRWITALLLVVALGLLVVPVARAGQVISEEEYVVGADEVIAGDLYVFANEIVIQGEIDGDLIAGCSTLTIESTGRVSGDLQAAGREIVVAGEVGDDARVAGFRLALEGAGSVADDLLAAGYSVEIGSDALVNGDVRVAARQGVVDGVVQGNVHFAGSGLKIGGQIAGDVYADVDAPSEGQEFDFGAFGMPKVVSVDQGLTVSDDAGIDGTLIYTAPQKSDLPEGVAAAIDFSEREPTATEEEEERPLAVRWALSGAKAFVTLLVVGLLLLLILPRAVHAAERVASRRPLPSVGWGCLTLLVAVVGVVLLAIVSIAALVAVGAVHIDPLVMPILSISVVLGSLLTFGMVLLAWAGRVVVALWIGRRLLGLGSSSWSDSRWVAFLLGALVYCILWTIPYVGWIFDFLGILIGLGSIILGLRGSRQPQPAPDLVTQPLPAAG